MQPLSGRALETLVGQAVRHVGGEVLLVTATVCPNGTEPEAVIIDGICTPPNELLTQFTYFKTGEPVGVSEIMRPAA